MQVESNSNKKLPVWDRITLIEVSHTPIINVWVVLGSLLNQLKSI